jgi:hypothetical protein
MPAARDNKMKVIVIPTTMPKTVRPVLSLLLLKLLIAMLRADIPVGLD